MKDIAALWISMSACIPTYMLASSLIAEGMNWWQAVLTIFLGNMIVLIPMILNAHAGHEVRHPVPGLLPGLVRDAGRQRPGDAAGAGRLRLVRHPDLDRRRARSTRSLAIYVPGWEHSPAIAWLGINAAQLACFLVLLGRQHAVVIYRGIDSIRVLLNIKAPLLIALGLALLAWAYRAGGRLRADAGAALAVRRGPARRRGSSGRSSSRR